MERRGEHPSLALDLFIKEARDATRPAGMSDMQGSNPGLGKGRQTYAQPKPPAAMTRPDLISGQQALPPPTAT